MCGNEYSTIMNPRALNSRGSLTPRDAKSVIAFARMARTGTGSCPSPSRCSTSAQVASNVDLNPSYLCIARVLTTHLRANGGPEGDRAKAPKIEFERCCDQQALRNITGLGGSNSGSALASAAKGANLRPLRLTPRCHSSNAARPRGRSDAQDTGILVVGLPSCQGSTATTLCFNVRTRTLP